MSQTLLHTRSADGTTIAYEADGAGPPLLLIGGALNDRNSAAPIVPLLADRYTIVRFDRRGAPISKLALYEPPFIVDDARSLLPADHLERAGSLAPGEALEYFMTVA